MSLAIRGLAAERREPPKRSRACQPWRQAVTVEQVQWRRRRPSTPRPGVPTGGPLQVGEIPIHGSLEPASTAAYLTRISFSAVKPELDSVTPGHLQTLDHQEVGFERLHPPKGVYASLKMVVRIQWGEQGALLYLCSLTVAKRELTCTPL